MEGNLASARPARVDRFPYASWGPGAAVIGLFVALSAQSVFAGIALAIESPVGDQDLSSGASIVLQTFGALAFVAIPLVIATMGRVPWRDALARLGLRRFDSSAVAWMGVSIAAYLAFAAGYVVLVGEPEQEDIAEAFGSLPFQILLIAFAAPVSEEVFGGLHAFTGISAVPPLIAFGFILALLYEKTGSIVPGILLHALNNSVALAAQ
jgi:membrane protease YdiL (CAAX protease family)